MTVLGRRLADRRRRRMMLRRVQAELTKPPEQMDMTRLELDLTEIQTGVRPMVGRNCAFCGLERTPKDDNHAPNCPYWTIGPGRFTR
jgi:hypothetical protein